MFSKFKKVKEVITHPDSVLETTFSHYRATSFLILLALFIYLVVYPIQIRGEAKIVLRILVGGYLVAGPIFYFLLARQNQISKDKPSRSYVAAKFFWQLPSRTFTIFKNKDWNSWSFFPDVSTKQAVLISFVKFFFAPLMISFFFDNLAFLVFNAVILEQWATQGFGLSEPSYLWKHIYGFTYSLLISVDTIIFAFAYIVEHRRFGNKIKSVEPTILGWASALICYPPLVRFAGQFSGEIGLVFYRPPTPVIAFEYVVFFEVLALMFFAIYVWASIALGAHAGNLVNRGIINSGPYRYVRHPAYICKNLGWLSSLIPFLYHPYQLIIWCFWVLIYVVRAMTEEKHLIVDPQYQEYQKQVPYRFIPKLV